jgi:GMP synthase (glutamine-hydrolysing)
MGCEPLGTVAEALATAGLTPRCHLSDRYNPPPADLGGAAGLIVLGGPMGVYEQGLYPYLADELRLIERALHASLPVLGICLGAQLLAAALGAVVRPGAEAEIGWYPVDLNAAAREDALWLGVGATFMGFHWHGDVFELPAGAVSLASSAVTPFQAFRYDTRTYGLQFHMEVTEAVIEDWLVEYGGTNAREIRAGISEYLPAMQDLARLVFGRWAVSVAQNAR